MDEMQIQCNKEIRKESQQRIIHLGDTQWHMRRELGSLFLLFSDPEWEYQKNVGKLPVSA